MASISSIGIGSGVLTSDLIDKLTNAEREPTEKRLNAQEDSIKARLSDFGRIQSAITEFRLSARTLGNASALGSKTATSSNAGISVTASTSAAAAQYSMSVTSLAQSHSISTGVLADQDQTSLGTGSITIKTGTATKTINLTNSNNTLQGLAKEINSAKLGISASVINTGSGYQLVMTSEKTGLANAIDISVTDDDGDNTDANGLSQLAFNATTKNLEEKIAAKDAAFTLNGVSITRSTNTISDVISGLTFDLTAETTSPATIKVGRDTDAVTDRVKDFVDKFNEIFSIIKEVTAFKEGGQSGSLLGNAAVRNISSQMKGVIAQVIPGLENASVRTLSEIGISTNTDTGLLEFDADKFKAKLATSEQDVVGLFADQGRTSDSQIEYMRPGVKTKVGTYDIEVTQLATQGNFAGTVGLTGNTVVDANNNSFKIKVDGTESNLITLSDNAAGYTNEELVAEIQNQINADTSLKTKGVSVTVSLDASNQLVFTSNAYGSKSNVEFTQVGSNSLASLGIDAIAGNAGLDVAGKINGKDATGIGQTLTAADNDDASGIQIKVTGGAIGARGSVTYSEGVGDQFVKQINSFLDLDGTVSSASDSFNKQLEQIAKQREKLDLRISNLTTRLAKQFTAADILISQLKNTENYVKNQLAALSGNNNDS